MPDIPHKRTALYALAALLTPAALAAAMAWYYDVYVNWQPKLYPFAIAAVLLGAAMLTLLLLWVRHVNRGDSRKEKRPALLWKILSSLLICPLLTLVGLSFLINNVLNNGSWARLAASYAIPLSAAYMLFQCVLLFTALWKQHRKGAWALLAGLIAAALAVTAVFSWDFLYRVPQEEIAPVFPEARPER